MKDPPTEIRSAQDLSDDMKGLIIPGGESTVMGHLLKKNAFLHKINNWLQNGEDQKFVWGTCAGLILLANQLENAKEGGQCLLGGLTIYYVSIILYLFDPSTHFISIL